MTLDFFKNKPDETLKILYIRSFHNYIQKHQWSKLFAILHCFIFFSFLGVAC